MKKRLIAAIVSVGVILSMACMPAVAATDSIGILPMWVNTSSITLAMSYESGTVNWNSSIIGEPNTTNITATYTLYKKNSYGTYSQVGDPWSFSSTTQWLTASGSASGSAGTYKISVTAKVTRNGTTETVDNSFETALP